MNHPIGMFLSFAFALNGTFAGPKRKSNYSFKWQVDHEIYTLLFGLNGWKLKIRFMFVVRQFFVCADATAESIDISI